MLVAMSKDVSKEALWACAHCKAAEAATAMTRRFWLKAFPWLFLSNSEFRKKFLPTLKDVEPINFFTNTIMIPVNNK